jgi:hypothetical protein
LFALGACSGDVPATTDGGARVLGGAVVGGRVVSTVDGHPIELELVAHAARSAGVDPELALRRLQDEELLAGAAARAGLDRDPEVERAARRAAVQALLARTVEREITEEDLDRAAIEAAYDAAPTRYDRPERRRSTYALASVPSGDAAGWAAAEAWARTVLAEVTAAPEAEAALLAVRRRSFEGQPFQVEVEDVPPLARTDVAEPTYLDALYEVSAPGLVPHVVRTSLGWHVVVVTEIEPAIRLTRDEAIERLLGEALAARRAAWLEEHVLALGRAAGVRLDPAGLDRAMRDPSLLGGEE